MHKLKRRLRCIALITFVTLILGLLSLNVVLLVHILSILRV